MRLKLSQPKGKCPVCGRGKIFFFPGPEQGMAYAKACDNPHCDWIDTTDHFYTPERFHVDTRRQELGV